MVGLWCQWSLEVEVDVTPFYSRGQQGSWLAEDGGGAVGYSGQTEASQPSEDLSLCPVVPSGSQVAEPSVGFEVTPLMVEPAVVLLIWMERNERCFNDKELTLEQLQNFFVHSLLFWFSALVINSSSIHDFLISLFNFLKFIQVFSFYIFPVYMAFAHTIVLIKFLLTYKIKKIVLWLLLYFGLMKYFP